MLFPTVSRRVVQSRLQKLHAHGYLKRLYVPVVLDGEHSPLTHSRQPIYTLSPRGMRVLREERPEASGSTPWSPERPSVQFLAHHLVVTDCLAALAVATRSSAVLTLVNGSAEHLLWSELRRYRQTHRLKSAVVPDGVFTLRYLATGETLTFYVEVVRADVRGGNRRLLDKLRRYGELHRQGFFREAYGHDRLRAVLFATTSAVRAEHLRRLASTLVHSRRLFWFGSYQAKNHAGQPKSRFTAAEILMVPWYTGDGTSQTLLQPHPPQSLEADAP